MNSKKKDHKALASALDTISTYNMLEQGDSVLVSVSGGPDSVFLTHVLYLLKDKLGLDLYGFSLDHSTRGGQSGRDLGFVRGLYRQLGIRLFSRKVDAAGWCREHKLSFQEGARKLRMGMLEEIAAGNNIKKIALGHNLDDNIETFLMRMIRGAGARGLSGIRPASGRIIRPLINTSRDDIEDYLKENNMEYCLDSSNRENRYLRNRIRNRLIPFIRENFAGNLTSSIKRSMEILRDEDTFLSNFASHILGETARFQRESKTGRTIYIMIPAEVLRSNPAAVRRRILISALEQVCGDLEDITGKNIEDILGLADRDTGENKWLRPVEPVMVFRIDNFIHVVNTGYAGQLDAGIRSYVRERSGVLKEAEKPPSRTVKIGGETRLPGFSMHVRATLLSDPGDFRDLPGSKVIVDYTKVIPPITVRSWREGDRFYPLGLGGSKKLQDFFTDSKIAVNRRDKVPVFCDRKKIIWVGNMRIDSRVRITGDTSRFLCLELFEK